MEIVYRTTRTVPPPCDLRWWSQDVRALTRIWSIIRHQWLWKKCRYFWYGSRLPYSNSIRTKLFYVLLYNNSTVQQKKRRSVRLLKFSAPLAHSWKQLHRYSWDAGCVYRLSLFKSNSFFMGSKFYWYYYYFTLYVYFVILWECANFGTWYRAEILVQSAQWYP